MCTALRRVDGIPVKVCKKFLLPTLGIGADQFRRWTAMPRESEERLNPIKSKKTSQKEEVIQWLSAIPKTLVIIVEHHQVKFMLKILLRVFLPCTQ